jgi:glycine oxidase
MHIIIIGNGIIALSTAFRLSKKLAKNDKITIIGKNTREGSATMAAAAMLNSFAEIEAGSLEHEVDLFRFELSHQATRMWPKFEMELIEAAGDELPAGCANCQGCNGGGCFDSGTYVVNNTTADNLDDENFDAILKALTDFNEPHELVSPDSIPNYNPEPRSRATRAVYIHNEGWFNPKLMIEKIQNIVAAHPQITLVDQHVEKLIKQGNTISSVLLSNGDKISGDQFLLATGASASDLIDKSELGIKLQRIFYGVGVSIEIKSPDSPAKKCIRTPNRGLACGLYSVPYYQSPLEDNDHILIGSSNFISPTPYPYGRLASVEHLMSSAIKQINANYDRADFVRANVGWRPTSQDSYPLIGQSSIDNLIIATGTKRDGFHLAPLLSEYLVSVMLKEPNDERMSIFAPERKLIHTLNREEAINLAVKHKMNAAYQHGFEPSNSKMPNEIRRLYRDDLEKLHDNVGANDWGIPLEMLDMYRYGHAK